MMRARRGGRRWLAAAGAIALGLVVAAAPARADHLTQSAQADHWTQTAQAVSFATWLDGVRADARTAGIRPQTLDAAFAGVAPLPRVIELDHKQPEGTLGFGEYLDRVMPPARIDKARGKLAERRPLLDQIAQRYGVPPRVMVALWGVESDFGQQTGGFSVIASLATLAYDGRRSSYFRGELLDALRILDHGDVPPTAMKGSWAGAMGQSQFMPSTFLRYAVDYDGDGRRDIWSDGPDMFASIANYLAQSGWQAGESWGRAVALPPGIDPGAASLDVVRPAVDWAALGVARADGAPLDPNDPPSALILPGGAGGAAFLVFENFRVLLRWNRSNYFAAAVGLLADRIE